MDLMNMRKLPVPVRRQKLPLVLAIQKLFAALCFPRFINFHPAWFRERRLVAALICVSRDRTGEYFYSRMDDGFFLEPADPAKPEHFMDYAGFAKCFLVHRGDLLEMRHQMPDNPLHLKVRRGYMTGPGLKLDRTFPPLTVLRIDPCIDLKKGIIEEKMLPRILELQKMGFLFERMPDSRRLQAFVLGNVRGNAVGEGWEILSNNCFVPVTGHVLRIFPDGAVKEVDRLNAVPMTEAMAAELVRLDGLATSRPECPTPPYLTPKREDPGPGALFSMG